MQNSDLSIWDTGDHQLSLAGIIKTPVQSDYILLLIMWSECLMGLKYKRKKYPQSQRSFTLSSSILVSELSNPVWAYLIWDLILIFGSEFDKLNSSKLNIVFYILDIFAFLNLTPSWIQFLRLHHWHFTQRGIQPTLIQKDCFKFQIFKYYRFSGIYISMLSVQQWLNFTISYKILIIINWLLLLAFI